MRIFLIRHGFSEGNENLDNYTLRGDSNVRLTDKGWEQAIDAGAFIADYIAKNPAPNNTKPRMWVSPFQRTRETASGILHGAGAAFMAEPARIQEALTEQDFGIYSHLHTPQDRRKFSPLIAEFIDKARDREKFFARFPLGESPYDVQRRIKPFFDTIFRDKNKGIEDHICITHGVTLRAFAMAFMHIDPQKYTDFPNPPNCGIYVIESHGDGKGYSLKQIYDGESRQAVDINWGEKLRAGTAELPPVPQAFQKPQL